MKKQNNIAIASLLLSTISSIAFAADSSTSYAQTKANLTKKFDKHKGTNKVTSNYPSEKSMEPGWPEVPLSSSKKFTPFVAKSVLITFDNELELPDLNKEYQGKMITSEVLLEINRKLVDCFIKHDYLLPQITIDKNAMYSGILKFDIKLGSINEVIIVGEGDDNERLKDYATKIVSNEPAKKSYVQRYLALMNKIPGFEINYQLKQSENSSGDEQLVDLIVYTRKKKMAAFAGMDDYGTNSLGNYQFHGVAEAFTPFSSSDSLLFHGSTTNYPDRLSDIGAAYSSIINSYGTAAHLLASYSRDNPTKGQQYTSDSGNGKTLSFSVTHPLYLRAKHDLELELGTNYKNFTSYEVVNNVSQKYQVSKYTYGDIGLNYVFDGWLDSKNMLKVEYLGGLGGSYDNYVDPTDTADKHFKIYKLDFRRTQELPHDFSIYTHASISHSNSNLPDTELAYAGGQEFGRGYDIGTLDGTKMHAFAAEIRYTKELNNKYYIENIQPYVFGDYSHVNRQDPSTTVSHIESAGAGVRIRFMGMVDLGMEVAQPLKKNFVVDQENINANTRFNFFLNKVFEF